MPLFSTWFRFVLFLSAHLPFYPSLESWVTKVGFTHPCTTHSSVYYAQQLAFIEHLLCTRPILFSQTNEVGATTLFISWMSKLRPGEVMSVAQGCSASGRQSWSFTDWESSDGVGRRKVLFCFFRRKYGSRA